ncbi:MAG: hypothetical protein P4L53_13340 [Candidatus Obscuribacterales bacterium]|nr:hypothetical protein [Candidatus Obscuribacterales bacterium]
MHKLNCGINLNKCFHVLAAKATARKLARPDFLSLGVALSLTMVVTFSMASAFASTASDLERLEQKFFQHSYPKDEMPVRLERLEKMVFGETKTGSDSDRLAKLVTAIPAPAADETASGSDNSSTTSSGNTASAPPTPKKRSPKSGSRSSGDDNADTGDKPVASDEKYPAVTAIELKVLGKDHSSEDINSRLARLETKVFGKPSSLTDLSDRTDALKQKTGIDIARQAPKGSDWADDDDDDMTVPRSNPVARGGGRGQQGYDEAYSPPARSGSYGAGSYGSGMSGMGSASSAPSGFYGAGQSGRGYPVSAPPRQMTSAGMPDSGPGVAPQVNALEIEVFGKNYPKDTLGARLTRLEATVFPADKNSSDKTLPERAARLAAVIPISVASTRAPSRRGGADSLDDLDSSVSNLQQQVNQQQRSSGGLGKVISSLSNMFSGGYSGGYQMPGGTMTTDPQTGMLYDPSSGNLIDPNTGAVVGRRSSGSYGGTYNTGGMGNMGGFTNGFSPYGTTTPYGSTSPYGGSGYSRGGMNFGVGSGRGFGGMWP